jgi:hypothetical protein
MLVMESIDVSFAAFFRNIVLWKVVVVNRHEPLEFGSGIKE